MKLFTGASPDTGFPILDQLMWNGNGSQAALQDAEHLLAVPKLPEELASWLIEQPERSLERIADRSLERTTHFKWFLGARQGKYTVWLHEYKSPDTFAHAADFAASVHNHRYGFCSRVLSGALHITEFAKDRPGEPIKPMRTHTLSIDETMLLSPEDVHRVDQVDPHTCTLIIQGPVTRCFSTCYNIASGSQRRVYDLPSRLPRVIKFLAAESRPGISVG